MDTPFYASYKKTDQIRYQGFFAAEKINNIFGSRKAFDVTTTATKDMKIASREKAAKIFADLCKEDAEFREDATYSIMSFKNRADTKKQKALAKLVDPYGLKYASEKTLMGKTYDAFNVSLSFASSKDFCCYDKFYKKLMEHGYSAILDLNDHKYSSYKSNSPVIVFDIASVVKQQVKRLSEENVMKNVRYATLINNGQKYLAGLGLAIVGGSIASAEYKKRKNEKEQQGEHKKRST